jgi:4-hydroxy-tetrahydrodipicolinate synthase
LSVPELVRIATDFPNCRAIKAEDDPTPVKIGELRNALNAANVPMKIFGGLGGMFFIEELKRGAVGTMTGFSFPEVIVDVYQRFARGDVQGATDVFFHYLPLIRYEFLPIVGLSLRKAIYMNRGIIRSATVRAPAPQLNADTLAELHDLVRRLGLNPGRELRRAPAPSFPAAVNGNASTPSRASLVPVAAH